MVWVLLVSLLLLWLVALIESMILSVPVSHHWRIKSAICMFYSSKLYIPVTKHIKPFKSLAPETMMVGTQEAFWGKESLFVCLLNQSLSQIKSLPNQLTPWQFEYQAGVCQKGSFPGENKRKTSDFCQMNFWNGKHHSVSIWMLREGKNKRREDRVKNCNQCVVGTVSWRVKWQSLIHSYELIIDSVTNH